MRSAAAQTLDLDNDHESRMTDGDMARVAKLVYQVAGIVLDEKRKALVVGRLAKRLRALNMDSYKEYVRFVGEDPKGAEVQQLINAITTNKTSFFREPHHFAHVRDRLQELKVAAHKRPELRRAYIWSAACSTGEEPYSLAMTVAETIGHELSSWDIKILATDIDSEVLGFAQRGAYGPEKTRGLPARCRPYFRPTRAADGTPTQTVRDEIKRLVTFDRLNLMDNAWPISEQFDHLFCRNVTIYFDRETQAKLYPKLLARLRPDGYFYAGHSENLAWYTDLRLSGLTIYVPSGSGPRLKQRPAEAAVSNPGHAGTPGKTHQQQKRAWGQELPEKSLIAGDVVAAEEAMVLKTTLGSCISVCLYDPVKKMGGMNHFMLPSQGDESGRCNRFGVHAMETLINQLLRLGSQRRDLVAKVAGASRLMEVSFGNGSVSQRNIEFIEQFLLLEGIPVVGKKLGGDRALEVRFRTDTGDAIVRAIESSAASRVAKSDEAYARELSRPEPDSDDGVTLFQ